jgi:hydroxypyruvate reductase/glycerate 2-kinase
MSSSQTLRDQALAIWQAAVDAVRPSVLIRAALEDPALGLREACSRAARIIVVGGGKAGAAMAVALEEELPDLVRRMRGVVNVPNEAVRPTRAIRLHGSRPAGTNSPTAQGVEGSREMLELVRHAGPDDVVLCLLSGGGSALMPAPADGVSLEDKQQVTQLLHACGATINEMNAVRKHLSAIKGGRLAQAFHGRTMFSLIISDVVGDPLDVIASGPTAADPATFAGALGVLQKYDLHSKVPSRVIECLRLGAAGKLPETLKEQPANVRNFVLGNNVRALAAAQSHAARMGYAVLNLGSYIEGQTRDVALVHAGIVRSIRQQHVPVAPPACLLSGGETTVTLGPKHGKGGRNQEFVLACLLALGAERMHEIAVLSGGTDGEDGPTDAAGAVGDRQTLLKAEAAKSTPSEFLDRHDAYTYFDATGDLVRTGLTDTNVMDVRVILIA